MTPSPLLQSIPRVVVFLTIFQNPGASQTALHSPYLQLMESLACLFGVPPCRRGLVGFCCCFPASLIDLCNIHPHQWPLTLPSACPHGEDLSGVPVFGIHRLVAAGRGCIVPFAEVWELAAAPWHICGRVKRVQWEMAPAPWSLLLGSS